MTTLFRRALSGGRPELEGAFGPGQGSPEGGAGGEAEEGGGQPVLPPGKTRILPVLRSIKWIFLRISGIHLWHHRASQGRHAVTRQPGNIFPILFHIKTNKKDLLNKVSKDGGFTIISQVAGSLQNWIAGGRRPLMTKTSQEKLSKSTARHLIMHASISQRRALQVMTMCQAKTAVSCHARTPAK